MYVTMYEWRITGHSAAISAYQFSLTNEVMSVDISDT